MKSFNFGIPIFLLLIWSCKNPKGQTGLPVSDTILVLNQALSEATSVKFMPDADALKQPYQFKDSILLSSQASILNVLPESVDGQNFKVMEENKITSILKADSNNINLPNYLLVSNFEANDSGYFIQIENRSALRYGGGGSLGLYYVKKGDSLINVKRSTWSIN